MRVALTHRPRGPLNYRIGSGKIRVTNAQDNDVFATFTGLFGLVVQIPDLGCSAFYAIG